MRILITDVTRMEPGYICVAGIEEGTRERIRPILPDPARIPLDWVASRGGVIDVRRVLEIGPAPRIGRVPEIEDVLTEEDRVVVVGALSQERFFEVVRAAAVKDARASFGPTLKLHANGRNYVTPHGRGDCSLVFEEVPVAAFRLTVNQFNGVRAEWPDGMRLSVTDLRLFEPDGATVDRHRVRELDHALQGESSLVGFGLTRPRSVPQSGDPATYHWLQINAVHLPASLAWGV